MKTIKIQTILKQIADGKTECETDLKVGYVQVRNTQTGKRETVKVVAK